VRGQLARYGKRLERFAPCALLWRESPRVFEAGIDIVAAKEQSSGGNVLSNRKSSAVCFASFRAGVELLLAVPGCAVNLQDTESGWSALHRALYSGVSGIDIVAAKEQSSGGNVLSNRKSSAVCFASFRAARAPWALDWVELLLAVPGCAVNLQDTESGWSALHRALYSGARSCRGGRGG
jgi:hypothetical protein